MPKRSSTDINTLAKGILDKATEGKPPAKEKDPLAVELGRRGGLKGGKARAAALSGTKRKAIAKKAAKARWGSAR